MTLDIFQVDAFSAEVFGGNPAAVIPLSSWLPERLMQQIAAENNLSETAFFVALESGFHIRWFTPVKEVDFCGHATMATAHVLFKHLNFVGSTIHFLSRIGTLKVSRTGRRYTMTAPADVPEKIETPHLIRKGLGIEILETWKGREDYLVVIQSQEMIDSLKPDFKILAELGSRGVLVTAPGTQVDFVSRCFFPAYGIDEDPVTGSAHTTLVPYWARRLQKNSFLAEQRSARKGLLECSLEEDRVLLSGHAATYLAGQIFV